MNLSSDHNDCYIEGILPLKIIFTIYAIGSIEHTQHTQFALPLTGSFKVSKFALDFFTNCKAKFNLLEIRFFFQGF